MEREHYRRVTVRTGPNERPAKASVKPDRPDDSPSSLKEKILMQAIVAALAMVAVMGVCLLDFDFTQSARAGIRQALVGETTPRGLLAQLQGLGAEWLSRDEAQAAPVPLPEAVPVTRPQNPPQSTSPAVIGEDSKSPVPELPVYPEP
jgi:hypothetical protein